MENKYNFDFNILPWVRFKIIKLVICTCSKLILNIFRVVFCLFTFMNLVLWAKNYSVVIPFSTLFSLLLWLCVSVPLTFFGAYIGFQKRVSILKIPIYYV